MRRWQGWGDIARRASPHRATARVTAPRFCLIDYYLFMGLLCRQDKHRRLRRFSRERRAPRRSQTPPPRLMNQPKSAASKFNQAAAVYRGKISRLHRGAGEHFRARADGAPMDMIGLIMSHIDA